MGREQMFATGRLRPVDEPTEPHGFDQVSKTARKDARLSHRAFRVLATLESYCFREDRESWACNRTIGTSSGGIGPNAVRLALRELEKLGYIAIIPDISRMRGSRIQIRFHLVKPVDRADLDQADDRE